MFRGMYIIKLAQDDVSLSCLHGMEIGQCWLCKLQGLNSGPQPPVKSQMVVHICDPNTEKQRQADRSQELAIQTD